MRLIDADALEEKFRRVTAFERTQKDKGMVYVERSCIDGMPNIDPVHAAGGCYCRECKSFDKDDEGLCICKHDGGLRWPHDNNFCKYGRKREESDGMDQRKRSSSGSGGECHCV